MLKKLAEKMGMCSRYGRQGGQTTAEYAIIVALIAICSIGVILIFGDQIRALFAGESHRLAGDTTTPVQKPSTDADSKIKGSLDNF